MFPLTPTWKLKQEASLRSRKVVEGEVATAAQIRCAALDLLAGREHSYQELITKLSRRFAGEALLRQELDRLVQDDLQSDSRYCEIYVRSRSRRGYGPRRISQELRQRGVCDEFIREQVWHAGYDWRSVLQNVCQKRFGDKPPLDSKDTARRIRFLQSRGFDFDLIREVLLA